MISHDKDNVPTFVNDIFSEQLNNIVSRIERLEHDNACVGEDIKAVYSEANLKDLIPKLFARLSKSARRMLMKLNMKNSFSLPIRSLWA